MDNENRKRYEALANFRLYKFVLWILFSFCIGIFLFYVLDRCDVFPPHANRMIVPDEILTRTDAYELFDKQFSHLLTTFGIILSVFGIALPVISYFFQRVSLRDEREAIQHEIEVGMSNIKERENKFENEFDKIKQAQHEAQQAIEKANKALEQSQISFNSVTELVNIVQNLQKDIINRNAMLWNTMNTAFVAMAVQPQLQTETNKAYVNYYYILALQCLIWKNQISGSSFLLTEDTNKILTNLNLIDPEKAVCYVSQFNCDFLKQGKIALQKYLQINDQQSLEITVKLFTLLDEKIAAYEKLLATADNNE